MLRAMDSAVSGLRAHQNKLDVIGHNIANVNTYGFKSQSYTFKDTMYQTSTASTNGTNTAGGVNAAQYGYGALMGVISMDMTASTPSYKGGFNATIDGDGFFITKNARTGMTVTGKDDQDALKGNDLEFTRVGQFTVDSNGYIVDGNGNFVYGFRAGEPDTLQALRVPTDGSVTVTQDGVASVAGIGDVDEALPAGGPALEAIEIQINKMGDIQVTIKKEYDSVDDQGNPVKKEGTFTLTMGQVAIATFQNQEGLTKNGNGYYTASPSDNTGICSAAIPGDGRATLMPGYLEASNVDLATEFSEMITTERGFQANSKIITVSDEILSDLINMKR
ncbi:MAG: flagellar hook-basal body complex protein [Lachnospiraceae bacterium]|nr:flagellar hook-basal body complex protein [Lachnospiraceae bacterium]